MGKLSPLRILLKTRQTRLTRTAFFLSLGLVCAPLAGADEATLTLEPVPGLEDSPKDLPRNLAGDLESPSCVRHTVELSPIGIADEMDAPDEPLLDSPGPKESAPSLPNLSVFRVSPVRGSESSGFGWRNDPIRHDRRFHAGTDFRAARGTPVYAAAEGIVTFCGRGGGYGRLIVLYHGGNLFTRYGHLSRIGVACGERIAADSEIGQVGATGRATGPHLHFEVRFDGRAIDPVMAVNVGRTQAAQSADSVATTTRPLLSFSQDWSTRLSRTGGVNKALARERNRSNRHRRANNS